MFFPFVRAGGESTENISKTHFQTVGTLRGQLLLYSFFTLLRITQFLLLYKSGREHKLVSEKYST